MTNTWTETDALLLILTPIQNGIGNYQLTSNNNLGLKCQKESILHILVFNFCVIPLKSCGKCIQVSKGSSSRQVLHPKQLEPGWCADGAVGLVHISQTDARTVWWQADCGLDDLDNQLVHWCYLLGHWEELVQPLSRLVWFRNHLVLLGWPSSLPWWTSAVKEAYAVLLGAWCSQQVAVVLGGQWRPTSCMLQAVVALCSRARAAEHGHGWACMAKHACSRVCVCAAKRTCGNSRVYQTHWEDLKERKLKS